jgi:glycine cleavage system H protein
MVPENLKYTPEHEWAKLADGVVVVGITDHAQDQLGDIVFVDLPAEGADVKRGDEVIALESTKAAASVYASVDGTIAAVNDRLSDEPELVNNDCYSAGWMVKIQPTDPSQLDEMLDAAAYEACLE